MTHNIQIITTENFVIEIDKTLEIITIKDTKTKNDISCCIEELLNGEEKNRTLTIKIKMF